MKRQNTHLERHNTTEHIYKQNTSTTEQTMSLSCITHVKRGPNGERPKLVKQVRCASDLFTEKGELKGSETTAEREDERQPQQRGSNRDSTRGWETDSEEIKAEENKEKENTEPIGVGESMKRFGANHGLKIAYGTMFVGLGLIGAAIVGTGHGIYALHQHIKAKKEKARSKKLR